MPYFIGIIIGLLLAIIVFLATKRYETTIQRTIKQVENKFKEQGAVFIPKDEDEDFQTFINQLPSEETLK
jgi:uncharacterized membrane protein YciS (DUF1049 family)